MFEAVIVVGPDPVSIWASGESRAQALRNLQESVEATDLEVELEEKITLYERPVWKQLAEGIRRISGYASREEISWGDLKELTAFGVTLGSGSP